MAKNLKPVNKSENPGLAKLPTEVRNKMGYMKKGGMIKRADGSYSKRGLYDNIRANKGSGKKPTPEMLEQERKIKRKEMMKSAAGGMMTKSDSMASYGKGGKKWIQKAIKNPGAFSKKAKAAGMSTSAYAAKVTKPGSKASATTKRQANLAKTLSKMRKRK